MQAQGKVARWGGGSGRCQHKGLALLPLNNINKVKVNLFPGGWLLRQGEIAAGRGGTAPPFPSHAPGIQAFATRINGLNLGGCECGASAMPSDPLPPALAASGRNQPSILPGSMSDAGSKGRSRAQRRGRQLRAPACKLQPPNSSNNPPAPRRMPALGGGDAGSKGLAFWRCRGLLPSFLLDRPCTCEYWEKLVMVVVVLLPGYLCDGTVCHLSGGAGTIVLHGMARARGPGCRCRQNQVLCGGAAAASPKELFRNSGEICREKGENSILIAFHYSTLYLPSPPRCRPHPPRGPSRSPAPGSPLKLER